MDIEGLNNIDQPNSLTLFSPNASKSDNNKAHKTNSNNNYNTFIVQDCTKTNEKKTKKDKKEGGNTQKRPLMQK